MNAKVYKNHSVYLKSYRDTPRPDVLP